jgi:hypothetical protein
MDGTTPEIHTNSGIPSDPIHDRSSLAHNLSKTGQRPRITHPRAFWCLGVDSEAGILTRLSTSLLQSHERLAQHFPGDQDPANNIHRRETRVSFHPGQRVANRPQ